MAKSQWFDPASHTPLIAEKARQLNSYLAAVADGVVDDSEVQAQEERVVKLMQELEPLLNEQQHAKVTELLAEITAYDLMQVLHSMQASRPKHVFQG